MSEFKETIKNLEDKMKKCVENLSKNFSAIRAGRANPAILDRVKVDYFGSKTSINQLAAVSVSDARILVISPWDQSTISLIEKAINMAEIGINPTSDGKVIRLTFPQLTKERREEIVKEVNSLKEQAKVSIRNVRREGLDELKSLKKNKIFNDDEIKIEEKNIQTLVDEYIDNIEKLSKVKEKEILEI